MVRILHTADVHLSPDADERQDALETVLSLAKSESVDLVTIGGDLFHSEGAAEKLRNQLRELFSGRQFPILTIPGNHDIDAFRRNLYFGEEFVPGTDSPFGQFELENSVRITYLPFTKQFTDDLMIAIQERDPFDGPEALLLHCSLEAPISGSTGDEEEHRYFPIKKEELAELGFDYYLAGHYHSGHHARLPNGGDFVYPGTPASTTKAEIGPRTVAIIDTNEDQEVQLKEISSFHYDSLDLRVTPGNENEVIERIRSRVDQWEDRNVSPRISVEGFTEMEEKAFNDVLAEAAEDVPLENTTRTVEHIITHPLFESFQELLEDRESLHAIQERDDYEVERFQEDVWELMLEVFAGLSAEGKLS